jgi:hypothetical protein
MASVKRARTEYSGARLGAPERATAAYGEWSVRIASEEQQRMAPEDAGS